MTTLPRTHPIADAVIVPIPAVNDALAVHRHHGHQLRIETNIQTAFNAVLIFKKQLGTALTVKALQELAIRNHAF